MPMPLSKDALNVLNTVTSLANRPANPEASLRNAARAVTIFGKMLEDMADKSAKPMSKSAKLVTSIGLLGYGIVEISVPRSLWYHLGRYWLKLSTLIAAAMFTLGVILGKPNVWELGLLVLLIVWLVSGIRDVFSWFMRSKRAAPLAFFLQIPLLMILACLTVLSITQARPISKCLGHVGSSLVAMQAEIERALHSR